MHQIVLPGTDLALSRLSFGTASLHHLTTSRRRQDLLAVALEQGFTHFDTAPTYGFGIAELELGRFLKTRKGTTTVATKVGLYPPLRTRPIAVEVWARKLIGRVVPAMSRLLVDWSIDAAKRSFETSFRRLAVEQIDLLLLHEPIAAAIAADAFLEWLQAEKRRGRIRAWGLAGAVGPMLPWLSTAHPLAMVLQVRDGGNSADARLVMNNGRDLQISYGCLSARVKPVDETLRLALRRNAHGSILVSTRRLERLADLAAICENEDG